MTAITKLISKKPKKKSITRWIRFFRKNQSSNANYKQQEERHKDEYSVGGRLLQPDGQHDPEFLDKMAQYLMEHELDMVIGSRFIEKKGFFDELNLII